MLSISNLSFYFGSRAMYEEANLHIRPKDRIAIIGANGVGKSTLLRLITGEYTPDKGNISKSSDCTIGFLNQDLLSYQTSDSILQVAMQAFAEQNAIQAQMDKVLAQMETDYSEELILKLANLQERFEQLDGYTMQAKAEEILEGLGFKTADLVRPLREFSGGWRMRVMLAKLLLQKPALLLLDEPTNHLDLPSIEWIEGYLQDYEGAVVVVSHDRYFLENVCNITVEVANRKLNYYAGNYSFYLEEKQLRKEIQKAAFENQQAKIRQTERFIERFKAKASKASQVQSRVKQLQRLDLIEDVIDENARVNFRFNFNQTSGKEVLKLQRIHKSFGNLHLLKNTEATILRGDKIALIGANGKGKSTLLRIIAGTEPIQGERLLGYNVNFSFFAQHQLESLHLDSSLLDELKMLGTAKTETELRNVLGCFLFAGEEVFKKIKVLSGGEKSRVALAKVLISQANFLLLDEPTNHLDMQSVNILAQALQQYEGTFVVVSHDRHFIKKVANKIWYIENQEIKEYLGTYEEFLWWQTAQELKAQEEAESLKNMPTAKPATKEVVPKKTEPAKDHAKQDLKKLQQNLEKLETTITELEKQKSQVEQELVQESIQKDAKVAKNLQQKYQKIVQELAQHQEQWERLAIQIDALA